MEPYQWEVNIGSGDGLVPPDSKLLSNPMVTQVCHHIVSLGHYELTKEHYLSLDTCLTSLFHEEITMFGFRGIFVRAWKGDQEDFIVQTCLKDHLLRETTLNELHWNLSTETSYVSPKNTTDGFNLLPQYHQIMHTFPLLMRPPLI